MTPNRAMGLLDAAERARVEAGRQRHSLAPGRHFATPVTALARRAREGLADDAAEVLIEGLATLDAAIDDAFPENLCGDLDFLVGSLCRGAAAQLEAAPWLGEQLERLATLQQLYGRHTAIRFRYVHDFIYGFDWAKWVGKAPVERGTVGPFDPPYLRFSEARGRELLDLIDRDDTKYPRLRDERPRNPFGFSREPEAELALHRDLAREGLLPVEAWAWDGATRWDRSFRELRRERAVALGLGL